MAVSKLSRRIGGLTAAIVLGITGVGVLAAPAQAADVTGSISLQVDFKDYADGMVAQVGQNISASLDSTADSSAPVTWAWFCGTTQLDQYGGIGGDSFTISPDNLKCSPMTIHATASVSGTSFTSAEIPLTTLSLDAGYQYTDFRNTPRWEVLQGYDPSQLSLGNIVVTNWGSTAVDGLSCSVAPQQGSTDTTSHFTIVTQPKTSLQPGTATVVQIRPVAGVAGTESGTSISETLTCKVNQGTKWATTPDTGVSLTVYSKPYISINGSSLQVGTVLNSDNVDVFPATDQVSYVWYSQAADGSKTNLSTTASYTVLASDVGKTLGVAATATIPGYDNVTADKPLGVVPPVAVTGETYWLVSYGYAASDVAPANVTFTNYGSAPVAGTFTCSSSTPALVCGALPTVTELAPGSASAVTITVTPQVGAKIGSYDADIYFRSSDNSVSSGYTYLDVSPSSFTWIQPQESTTNGGGTNGGGASGGGTTGGNTASGGATTGGASNIGTGGTASHSTAPVALLGLGFIALGAVILKRHVA